MKRNILLAALFIIMLLLGGCGGTTEATGSHNIQKKNINNSSGNSKLIVNFVKGTNIKDFFNKKIKEATSSNKFPVPSSIIYLINKPTPNEQLLSQQQFSSTKEEKPPANLTESAAEFSIANDKIFSVELRYLSDDKASKASNFFKTIKEVESVEFIVEPKSEIKTSYYTSFYPTIAAIPGIEKITLSCDIPSGWQKRDWRTFGYEWVWYGDIKIYKNENDWPYFWNNNENIYSGSSIAYVDQNLKSNKTYYYRIDVKKYCWYKSWFYSNGWRYHWRNYGLIDSYYVKAIPRERGRKLVPTIEEKIFDEIYTSSCPDSERTNQWNLDMTSRLK